MRRPNRSAHIASVQVGDLITATTRQDDVAVSVRGRVGHITDAGSVRVIRSENGQAIARWEPDTDHLVTVIIHEAAPVLPEPMFTM